MAQAMDLAYTTWTESGESEENFCNVLQLVWWELTEIAAKNKSDPRNPEPELFWKHVPPSVRNLVTHHFAQRDLRTQRREMALQELDAVCRDKMTSAEDQCLRSIACKVGVLPPMPSPEEMLLRALETETCAKVYATTGKFNLSYWNLPTSKTQQDIGGFAT